MPLGAQLIGPPHSDERLLAVVTAYQDTHQQDTRFI
jgi:Asp-tRNA(Asn)/Glu-tRNA(Gln) amidotransferase A subunit family amidase